MRLRKRTPPVCASLKPFPSLAAFFVPEFEWVEAFDIHEESSWQLDPRASTRVRRRLIIENPFRRRDRRETPPMLATLASALTAASSSLLAAGG